MRCLCQHGGSPSGDYRAALPLLQAHQFMIAGMCTATCHVQPHRIAQPMLAVAGCMCRCRRPAAHAVTACADQCRRCAAPFLLQMGLLCLCAVAVVLAVGRERMFRLVARGFEGSKSRMQQDGAFIASLLEWQPVTLGQSWFVHREEGDKDLSYDPSDHRHHWR